MCKSNKSLVQVWYATRDRCVTFDDSYVFETTVSMSVRIDLRAQTGYKHKLVNFVLAVLQVAGERMQAPSNIYNTTSTHFVQNALSEYTCLVYG